VGGPLDTDERDMLWDACSRRAEKPAECSPDTLDRALNPFHDRILGLAVLKPRMRIESSMTVLTVQQRGLYRFWNLCHRRDVAEMLLYFDIVVRIPFVEAQPLIDMGRRNMRTKYWSQVTSESAERMLDLQAWGHGKSVAEVIVDAASLEFGIEIGLPRIAVKVYTPHAFIMLHDEDYRTYCWPLLGGTWEMTWMHQKQYLGTCVSVWVG
jgi:hypothetical protein